MKYQGVYTVTITPFHSDGSFDEEGFHKLIERQVDAQVDGIVVLGTTGEAPTLSLEEKKKIIQIARRTIKSSTKLVVGTGSYSTETTIEETRIAENLGADAALVVTPYYNKPTQEGLYLHYKTLAESTKLPIILYNIQGRCGQNLATSTLSRLFEFPTIIGVKEASANIPQIMDVIEAAKNYRPDFRIFSGDDNLTLPIMALGGHGVLSVASNLVPHQIIELCRACLENNWEEARKLHYELLPLFRGIFIETNPIPIKALMQWEGLPAGPCRLPLCHLMPENEKAIRHLHKTLARFEYVHD